MKHSVDLAARSHGPADTATIAAAVADLTVAGDVIVLGGDLGAGKTAFTKAFGAGLDVTDAITSPTFTLHQRYDSGRLVVHHLDVYRIEQIEETIDLALPELFESGGVVVLEWGDTIAPALPASYLMVQIEFGEGDDDRILNFIGIGTAWQARLARLGEALSEKNLTEQVTA